MTRDFYQGWLRIMTAPAIAFLEAQAKIARDVRKGEYDSYLCCSQAKIGNPRRTMLSTSILKRPRRKGMPHRRCQSPPIPRGNDAGKETTTERISAILSRHSRLIIRILFGNWAAIASGAGAPRACFFGHHVSFRIMQSAAGLGAGMLNSVEFACEDCGRLQTIRAARLGRDRFIICVGCEASMATVNVTSSVSAPGIVKRRGPEPAMSLVTVTA